MANRNDALAKGVDVLGDGGYVVWWPGSGYRGASAGEA
jgi:hypothetical protein